MTSDTTRNFADASPFSKLAQHPLAGRQPADPTIAEAMKAAPVSSRILNPLLSTPAPAPAEEPEFHDDPDVPELTSADVESDFGPGVETPEFEDEDDGLDVLLANFDNAVTEAVAAGAASDEGAANVDSPLATPLEILAASDDQSSVIPVIPTAVESGGGHRVEFSGIPESLLASMQADMARDDMQNEVAGHGGFTADEDAYATEDLSGREEIPLPEVAPRTDPIQPIGMTDEFLTEEAVAMMADHLRSLNDEKLRANLMAILPQVFGAKSVTAENDVAIYIAENASFRNWLMAIFKVTGVDISPVSRSSVELNDGKLFLSRAPSLFDMRNAAIHALTQMEKWRDEARRSAEVAAILKTTQDQLAKERANVTEIERARQSLENSTARMAREADKVKPVNSFRIQWTVQGTNNSGQKVSRTAYLALRDTDTGAQRDDGVWPGKHYSVTYNEAAAENFASVELAFRTLEFIKSQSTRLMSVSKAFDQRFLVTAVVVQWAQIFHSSRPQSQKAAG